MPDGEEERSPQSDVIPGEGLSVIEPRLGLVRDVIDEITWTFTSRMGWVLQILANLLIGFPIVFYNQLDTHAPDDIRVSGFATSIASWVLCSVLTTNQLGFDADRGEESLAEGDQVARILVLKNIAIFVVLAPVIFTISAVLRVIVPGFHDSIPVAIVRDAAVITPWLGFGCIASVLLPFRPLGLRGRLAARATWPRFALCLLLPYAIWYGAYRAWHYPDLWVADAFYHRHTHAHEWGYSLVYLTWGLITWGLGLLIAQLLSHRLSGRLHEELAPPAPAST